MKIFALLLLLSVLPAAYGEIVQHDEASIESDLEFKWEQDEESKQRDVASSEEEGEQNDEDMERDVASEADENGVQFWKYQEE